MSHPSNFEPLLFCRAKRQYNAFLQGKRWYDVFLQGKRWYDAFCRAKGGTMHFTGQKVVQCIFAGQRNGQGPFDQLMLLRNSQTKFSRGKPLTPPRNILKLRPYAIGIFHLLVESKSSHNYYRNERLQHDFVVVVVVIIVYFILSRLLYLAYSANLALLCMPHPGMGPLV